MIVVLEVVIFYLFFNLFEIRLPTTLPAIPPLVPLIICPAVEFPNAILVPAATPEPIPAPNIDSPAAINPDVPPVNNASPAADAPPVNAAPPIVAASVPIFSIGILFPNPSVS
jgi:hypothetical protein